MVKLYLHLLTLNKPEECPENPVQTRLLLANMMFKSLEGICSCVYRMICFVCFFYCLIIPHVTEYEEQDVPTVTSMLSMLAVNTLKDKLLQSHIGTLSFSTAIIKELFQHICMKS